MDRRKFIKSAGIATGAAAATSLATPAIAQSKIDMVIVSTWPRDFPGLGTGAQRLAARITELTEGRINVQYFAAGERVSAHLTRSTKWPPATRRPIIAADYYWKGKHPAWAYFTSVPFGLTHVEQDAWINHMGGQALWDELASGFGLKSLMAAAPACRWVAGSTRKSTRLTTSRV
jgi:TRAP-type mannitol/chloroaromatic compound transport system substrate-binding protein